MFGWNVKPQSSSAQSSLIDALNHLLATVDVTSRGLNAKAIDGLLAEIASCDGMISGLSPTEQGKCGTYWSGVTMLKNTLSMYNAMPQMKVTMAQSMLPGVKTNILNTLNALS